MGSTVTQVSCGRRHTLALVPSRGRVYSFGLGGLGQLGGRKPTNAATPQVVMGPWVSPSGTAVIPTAMESVVIHRIFSGGDHCFATVTERRKHIRAYDFREFLPETQILLLNYEYISSCLKLSARSKVDQEMLSYLETVFKSLACFNGSFLLLNEEHYCCTSKHHGVNIELAEKTFSVIGKLEKQSIKDLVSGVQLLILQMHQLAYLT